MASSVFRSLILFREVPWYCLVYYVQAIITTTRGLLDWSSFSEKLFTADCYSLSFYSQYRYSELSKLFLFILLQNIPAEVHSLLLNINLQRLYYFYYVLY